MENKYKGMPFFCVLLQHAWRLARFCYFECQFVPKNWFNYL